MLLKRMTKVVKIICSANNLRLMPASSQKKISRKKLFGLYLLNQNNSDVVKNKLLDLDKCFYCRNFSYNQIHKLAILNTSKKNEFKFKYFFSVKKLNNLCSASDYKLYI